VNIGTRQKGRLRAGNVIDTDFDTMSIVAAVTEATSFEFKKKAAGYESYFGDGHASERLVKMISQVPLDAKLLGKSFNDFTL
jgi:UDP-N-acetylglucosamine 2-epimerase